MLIGATSVAYSQALQEIGCESGRLECQSNEVSECICEEAWVQDSDGNDQFLRVCDWQSTGDLCGGEQVSPCNRNFQGAEAIHAGGRKECVCVDDDCFWQDG